MSFWKNLFRSKPSQPPSSESKQQAINAAIAYALAAKLISGDGIERDEAEAVRLLESAAQTGHTKAQGLLGSTLRGRGRTGEAIMWLRKAADAGETDAQVELGMVYVSSGDPYRDYSKANEYWKAAARSGDGVAFANLGMLYANGLGVKRTPTKAILLLTAASALGNQPALGILKEVMPTLTECSTADEIGRMDTYLKKLNTLVAAGDRRQYCAWVIDNLDNLA